jgi:transcription elongation GreA/GreB family factor
LNFDVVEDRMPIAKTEVRVRVKATKATHAPSGQTLALRQEGDVVVVTVPAASGHTLVCLE